MNYFFFSGTFCRERAGFRYIFALLFLVIYLDKKLIMDFSDNLSKMQAKIISLAQVHDPSVLTDMLRNLDKSFASVPEENHNQAIELLYLLCMGIPITTPELQGASGNEVLDLCLNLIHQVWNRFGPRLLEERHTLPSSQTRRGRNRCTEATFLLPA